jgi:PBP1b-binding outer membrane lipoprotein LpoB
MKKVIAILLTLLMLVGCVKTTKAESESGKGKRFATIETGQTYTIVVDRKTWVMYAVSDGSYNHGTFTLLVDKDGSPLIWDGE